MSGEITPPQAAQNVQNQLLQQQQTQPISQQNINQQIYKLPVGAQVQAVVAGADKNGNILLKLGGSDLVLSSPIALAKGAALDLKVINTSGTVSFQLLSVDGKLPPTQAQNVSNQLLPNPQQVLQSALQAQGQQAQQPTQQSGKLILQVLSAQPQSAQAQAVQTQQAQVASVPQQAVIILSSQGVQTRAILLQTNNSSADASADASAESVDGEVPALFAKGTKFDLKITNIQNPASPQAPAQTATQTPVQAAAQTPATEVQRAAPAANQEAEVPLPQNLPPNLTKVEKSPEGKLIVSAQIISVSGSQLLADSPIGRLAINNQFEAGRVQVGATISFDVDAVIPPNLSANIDPELQVATLKDLFSEWPSLKALHQLLTNAAQNSGSAQSDNASHIGRLAGLDGLFSLRLVRFFNAVKNNNIENWLSSEIMQALDEQGTEGLKNKLNAEFASISKLYNDNSNTGWQTMLFPVYDGKELMQARFFVKDANDENGKSAGKRFVVEFSTGYLGEIQLDGFVRKQELHNKFDLMVRSSRPLPNDVRAGINEIFNNAAEITGLRGSIGFGMLDSAAATPTTQVLQEFLVHSGFEV